MALTYAQQLLSLAATVILVLASAILYRYLRTRAALALLIFVSLLGFYYSVYARFFHWLVQALPGQMNWLILTRHAVVPALLEFSVAVSFLWVVRTSLRPNNSFKPNPHRGGA